MACSKFEESGLLYLSGELGGNEAEAYESHLASCAECAGEVESYKRERAQFYTADILGEAPSAAADAEILRVCSDPKKMRAASVFAPMMFIKKYAPVPVFLMLVMVAVGGYVQYHTMNAEELRAKLVEDTPASIAAEAAALEEEFSQDGVTVYDETHLAALIDSLSGGDSARPKFRTQGNMDMEGVVTVKGGRE